MTFAREEFNGNKPAPNDEWETVVIVDMASRKPETLEPSSDKVVAPPYAFGRKNREDDGSRSNSPYDDDASASSSDWPLNPRSPF